MELTSTPLIETRGLTKVYSHRRGPPVNAVDRVDLKIRYGEFLAIVGRSGSGKTTLLNLIGSLDRPTSGSVIFEGKDLSKLLRNELVKFRRQKVGFIFQNFNLLPALTALENIEIALVPTHMSRKKREEKARALLDIFELKDKANHFPLELSGGQQQRLAIARSLANDPVLLIADEPTGELDHMTGTGIVSKLVELNKKNNITLLVASHGTFPYHLADRVLFISNGKIVSREEAGY